MKLLANLVLAVLVLVALAIGGGFLLPDRAHVERSIVIEAGPAAVFPYVNGFEGFNQWSPWLRLDPQMKLERQGPASGVGARQSWLSDQPGVGSGSQEIVESVENQRVRMRLEFTGFDGSNDAAFILVRENGATRVTWSYDTEFHGNIVNRYFGLLLGRMVGPDYERGLANLKAVVEQPGR